MTRRRMMLLLTLVLAIALAPMAALAQRQGHSLRLGMLDPSRLQRPAPCLPAFQQELRAPSYVDRPARPDPLPPELAYALGPHASGLTTVYRYDLGGFIDHQWLWRLDAGPEVVALVVSGLGLRRTDTVPQRFWRMPPHYWPRAMPVGAEAFQSPAFSADRRRPDGAHYFLLYDKAHGSAYVWFKSNF
jgi:hypothetical protein